MIIVKLIGGLGNQMFQYALGRHLSLLWQTDLKFDVTDLERGVGSTPRVYSLDCFQIAKNLASDKEIKQLKNNYWLEKLNINFKKSHIKEKIVGKFDANIFKTEPPFYLDGYWQSDKYFNNSAEIIRKDFRIKSEFISKHQPLAPLLNSADSVAIHIRRGDYMNNPEVNKIHNCCTEDYYKRAVDFLVKKIANPNFFIFSDDIKWVKDNFKLNYPTTYVSSPAYSDWQELILISRCQHQIIANSSFSWWGAWLNNNPDKIVIAPSKWFNNSQLSGDDIVPEPWQKI